MCVCLSIHLSLCPSICLSIHFLESFCKTLEEDAQERAKEREQRQRVGKQKKKEANEAFRSEDYTKSLTLYTEAIQHIPDDIQLYTNRALVSYTFT